MFNLWSDNESMKNFANKAIYVMSLKAKAKDYPYKGIWRTIMPLPQKVNRFINKVTNVMQCMSYCLTFSVVHTTFKSNKNNKKVGAIQK